jgi:uncharacterized SAM-binding protein YcdF (DUF218 family)
LIFTLTRLLNFFTSPINWIILFLILGLTVRNKLYKKLFIWLTIALMIVFTNGQLNLLALRAWSAPYSHPLDSTSTFEIAIVLGGSTGYNPELKQIDYNSRGDRMTEAIRLYRLGRVKKLYLTGESAFIIKKESKCYAPDFLQYMMEMGVNPKDIQLEQHARTTRENILNLQKLLGTDKSRMPCMLITSGWHMRRALKGFSNSGLILVPYAVDSPGPDESENWYDYLPSWRAALAWQELIHEIVGMAII